MKKKALQICKNILLVDNIVNFVKDDEGKITGFVEENGKVIKIKDLPLQIQVQMQDVFSFYSLS